MSKVNLHDTVTINELRTLIPVIGTELTPIVQSEPGCGKTSLLSMISLDNGDQWRKVGDYFESDKYDYIYVDCPVKDMADIGMTIPNHANKSLEYYVSSLFMLDSPKPKVILLDEFMKAPKLLQVIFTRLMLERTVGDRPLDAKDAPIKSIVFGTSNNASDGVGDGMLAHAGNRVCKIQMSKPDADMWCTWATTNKIARPIRAWVTMNPKVMYSYLDPNQEDNEYIFKPSKTGQFASPRSLAKADVIVRNRDKMGENGTKVALAGTIGASAAADMSAFLSLEKTLSDFKDIIKDPLSVDVPKEISAQLMLMFQAIDTMDTQDHLTKFMQFVERIKSSEVQSVFFTMMMRNQRTLRLARNNQKKIGRAHV